MSDRSMGEGHGGGANQSMVATNDRNVYVRIVICSYTRVAE